MVKQYIEEKCMLEKAYGKLNLFLDITGMRDDGYHELLSYMVSCELHDEVKITVTDTMSIEVHCDVKEIPLDESNLCFKTAVAFFEKLQIHNPGIAIHIKQGIPSGTGMGSASTDAAATLRGLKKIFAPTVSDNIMLEICSTLSADMSYCYLGGYKIASGIGNILRDGPRISQIPIVIAKPYHESFNTKEMYRKIDQVSYVPQPKRFSEFLYTIVNQPIKEWNHSLYNVFEKCIDSDSDIWRIKACMGTADACLMTGSGNGVVGYFSDLKNAERCLSELDGTCTLFLSYII